MTTLVLLALGVVVIYIGVCAFWPYAPCRRCDGSGKRRSPGGKAWRSCPRCIGTGRRVRIGRRVYEVLNGAGDGDDR